METRTEQLITTDRNSLRPIVWNVEYLAEAPAIVTEQHGWSHGAYLVRPKGRRTYFAWVEIRDGLIVRNTEPMTIGP